MGCWSSLLSPMKKWTSRRVDSTSARPSFGELFRGTSSVSDLTAAGLVCFLAVSLKTRFRYDDTLDVVGVHMVGGMLGVVLTGVFASLAINPAGAAASLALVGRQIVLALVTVAYSFGVTLLLLKATDVTGNGRTIRAIPVDALQALLKKYGR